MKKLNSSDFMKIGKWGLVILFLNLFALADYVPNQVIVKFTSDTPQEAQDEIISRFTCTVVDECMDADLHLLQVPESQTPEQMISTLQNQEAVEYAECNYLFNIFYVPNDPLFSFQWNLKNSSFGGVNMEKAWDIQKGDPNVVIAVLDSGVAYENFGIYRKAPDLAQTKFVPGYDFVNHDSHPNDDEGHGTHVTGTIAQSTNNGVGVAGVAFGCSIMPVKVIGSQGTGNVFDIVSGIYFAVVNDANIINMSLGADSNSAAMAQAVRYAWSNNVTIVCSAGNSFQDGNQPSYPAAYDKYCIAVGATRIDRRRAYYSNAGSYLDIVAPGGDITIDQNGDTFPDGILQQTFQGDPSVFDYWFSTGTSNSAPHVSGAAALLLSKGVKRTDKIRQALQQSAHDLGPGGWDKEYGWGLLDVAAALNYKVAGDLNGDLLVDKKDLAIFSDNWMVQSDTPSPADFNRDGVVNLTDYAVMIENWDK
jgi:serine protease